MKLTFHLLPRTKGEWRRVALFPFQMYVVIAFFMERHFWYSLPANGGYRGSLSEFVVEVLIGYIVCIFVLSCVCIAQLTTGHRRRGLLNIGLAVLGSLFAFSTPSLVVS